MTNYKELVKQRTSIPGWIEEVERFETWWNKNLATVIAYYDGSYRVFLLVYDPVYRTWSPAVFPTDNSCNYWGEHSRGKHTYPSGARSEANWLKEELTYSWKKGYDNPILVIHPYSDCHRSFDTFVTEPYVTKNSSTSYLKPLDIVKTYTTTFGFGFYHEGVYLGRIGEEFKVCQFTSKWNDTEIDKWKYFVEGEVNSCHPVVPFKNYKDTCGQMVWAKDNHFRKGSYDLHRRNCEHLANMFVYGIDFSEQIEKRKGDFETGAATAAVVGGGFFGGAGIFNLIGSIALAPATGGTSLLWGVVSTGAAGIGVAATAEAYERIDDKNANDGKKDINLRDEIRITDGRLGKTNDSETEKYETKYLQEVPAKDYNCRIM